MAITQSSLNTRLTVLSAVTISAVIARSDLEICDLGFLLNILTLVLLCGLVMTTEVYFNISQK